MKSLFWLYITGFALITISCKPKSGDDTSTGSDASGSVPHGIAYEIDAPRSEVAWRAFKPLRTHHGIVPVSGGTLYIKDDNITAGTVVINMRGLKNLDLEGEEKEKLEKHLKGLTPGKEEDFFNVGKYPTATFTVLNSDKLENDPDWTHLIQGELTMKDITHPVSYRATLDLKSGNALKATTESFIIDRTLWDIKFKSKKFFDNLKDDFINDEIRLEITLGAIKK